MNVEKVIDPAAPDEFYVLFDLGENDVGIVAFGGEYLVMDIYHDHQGNGSGCNNLVLDAFGREVDLEFCRSRKLDRDELFAYLIAEGDPFYNTGDPQTDALRRNVSGMIRAGLAEPIIAK